MTVTVLGSANLDRLQRVARLPQPGETMLTDEVGEAPGGKGLNQATAAARSGATTTLIAAFGVDPAAEVLLASLAADGVHVQSRRSSRATGVAVVTIAPGGENTIVVDPGANAELTGLSAAELDTIRRSSVLLAQLEVPLAAVHQALSAAREAAVQTILNAAPARPLPAATVGLVDVLVVNETEAALLAQLQPGDPARAAEVLAGQVPVVVVTLGAAGVLARTATGESVEIPALPVEPVDATGAGDTFCGAFAATRSAGEQLEPSLRFAVAAASLSVTRAGAVPSIPSRVAVLAALTDGRAAVG